MRMLALVALRNLLQARRRTLFLGSAIASVSMLLVLLLALSSGVHRSFVESAGAITTGHVNVGGFFKVTPSSALPVLTQKEELRAIVDEVAKGFEVERIIERHRGMSRVVSATNSTRSTVVSGIDVAQEEELLRFLQLAAPSEYEDGGGDVVEGDLVRVAEPNSVILFVNQAKHLGVGVGDVVTVRSDAMGAVVNTIDLEVVAVARDVGLLTNWTVFTSHESVMELFRLRPGTTGAFQLYLENPERAAEVAGRLREVFLERGFELLDHESKPYFWKFGSVSADDWVGQRLDLATWRDEVSYLTWILQAIDVIAASLIFILLAIMAIGIMNTMMMATRERTQEIGTLRAIGMGKMPVLAMVLTEAAMLGLAASLVGALLGAAISVGLDTAQLRLPSDALRDVLLSDVIAMRTGVGHIATAVGFLTTFTVLSAIWPAARAARLQPVTAMQEVT